MKLSAVSDMMSNGCCIILGIARLLLPMVTDAAYSSKYHVWRSFWLWQRHRQHLAFQQIRGDMSLACAPVTPSLAQSEARGVAEVLGPGLELVQLYRVGRNAVCSVTVLLPF